MPKRILITGSFADTAYSFGFFEQIAQALQEQGWEVSRFNAFGFATQRRWEKALERVVTAPARLLGISKQRVREALPWTAAGRRERALVDAVSRFRPQRLIVISGFRHSAQTLNKCRALGVQTLVGWDIEGPTEPGLPEAQSKLYDRYYCIHREIAPEFRRRIGHLPSYALDQKSFFRLRTPRQPRIVFVGTPSERRIRHLEALRPLGLEIWGPKWHKVASLAPHVRGEFIWGAELNELYNASAIVLNIASWESSLSGLTQRVVEIPASGAFMLTDATPELEKLYQAGLHCDVFSTPEELRRKCEYYLVHADEREAVAARGHERALTLNDFAATARILAGEPPGGSAEPNR